MALKNHKGIQIRGWKSNMSSEKHQLAMIKIEVTKTKKKREINDIQENQRLQTLAGYEALVRSDCMFSSQCTFDILAYFDGIFCS